MYWFLVMKLDVFGRFRAASERDAPGAFPVEGGAGVKEDSWTERVRCDVVNAAFEGAGVVGRVGRGAGGAGRPLWRLIKLLSMARVLDAGEDSLGKMVLMSGAITTHRS